MSKAVRNWLAELDLEQYAAAFENNHVDSDLLAELSEDDLKELGVTSLGHRKRLLRAIEMLKGPPSLPVAGNGHGSLEHSANTAETESGTRAQPSGPVDRRQLTIMFCDLADSTALSARLDPEDVRDAIRVYQSACTSIIAGCGGYIARYLGDGVLAYFGWPQSHEDDAERAVSAGLRITDAVRNLAPPKGASQGLAVRVGIATGPVVVGDIVGEGASQEATVTGLTPNLAARLQQVASPNTVVVSAATRQLVGELFLFESTGVHDLKGIGQGIEAWQVSGVHRVGSRFDAIRGRHLTRLVGRTEEFALLRERWASAVAGEGQVVDLSGEAGIGKSRLVQALIEHIGTAPHFRVRFQCAPNDTSSALSPAIRQLERAAGFEAGDDSAVQTEKLKRSLGRWQADDEESLALVANLLMLPIAGGYALPQLSPQQLKQRTLDVLSNQVFGLARQKPVLFILEDAHWIDPSSLELVETIVSGVAEAPVLAVVTHRPDWRAAFLQQPHVTSLQLSRLGHRQIAELIREVTSADIPAGIVEDITGRSDGIPLFVEEMTRAIVESGSGTGGADTPAIPESLQASLMARLDRISQPAKDLAQTASVIGREVPLPLLTRVMGVEEADIGPALDALLLSQLMTRAGSSQDKRIFFRHALIRDAAYQSLLLSRRREIHHRIAEAIEAAFPQIVELQPELVARHYAEAGDAGRAIDYWCRAGKRAVGLVANREAVNHYDNALKQLALTPSGPERDRRELAITLAMGLPLIAATGYASARVRAAYDRARSLSEQLGDAHSLFVATRGLWNCVFDRAELDHALELAQSLVQLATREADPIKQALAERALGSSYVNRGALADAVAAFDRCLGVQAPGISSAALADYGEAPGIISLQYKGYVRCVQGRPREGLELLRQAVEQARALRHPLSLAFTLFIQSLSQLSVLEFAQCRETASECLRLSNEHMLIFWIAGSRITLGCVTAWLGDSGTGLPMAMQGLREWQGTSAGLGVPIWTSLIAAASLASRMDEEEAAVAVEDALKVSAATHELVVVAELLRLRGDIAARRGDAERAEASYRTAVAEAERQGGHLYGLRAGASLARLLLDQGKQEQANEVLGPILGRFPQNEDFVDLAQARKLLRG